MELLLVTLLTTAAGILQASPVRPVPGTPSEEVPFLQQALDWLHLVPDGVELLDRHLGPIVPHNLQPDWQDLIDFLNTTFNDTLADRCSICLAGGKLVVQIIPNKEWEEWRDPLVNVCYALVLSVNSNTQADILCPGMIDMQGPPVYYIITQLNTGPNAPKPNVESACENLNLCFPPKENKTVTTEPKHSKGRPNHHRKDKKMENFKHRWAELKPLLNPPMDAFRRKQADQKKADPLIIAQLTDIHIDPIYSVGAATDCNLYVCCREEYAGEGEAGQWGEHTCNTPQRTINLFLEKVAEFDPDFILYSGDTPPHSAWEESYDSQLGCTKLLLASLNQTLSGYRIYPTIGNHEMFPTNLFYVPWWTTQNMSADFADLWQPFSMFEDEQMRTMEHACYYSTLVRPGLRLLSFNTLYWYSYNWFNTLNEVEDDVEEMYRYTVEQLQHARDSNEKVIFMGHQPPGNSDMLVAHTRRYSDIMLEYRDVIVMHVTGHTHRDHFCLVTDSADGIAKHVTLIAPSVTPKGHINPSVRLYEMDPDTFELLDYKQYTMDLEEANEDGDDEPEIQFSYSAKELYDLSDLSAESWQQLAHRFEDDDDLFQIYYQKYWVHTSDDECHEACKAARLCHIHNPNYDEYLECMDLADEPDI